MISVKEIVISYANRLQASPEKVKRAELRYKVCSTCEFNKKTILDREKCTKCGCFLQGKIFTDRGPEACPEKKWKV